MKRLPLVFLVCLLALVPTRASADDGGWWDWFWSWDPRFVGASSEIHLLCLDQGGNRIVGCEEAFRNLKNSIRGDDVVHCFRTLTTTSVATQNGPCAGKPGDLRDWSHIKHDIDFHFGYHHNYGDRYREPDTNEGEVLSSVGSINALKLMGMYYYHLQDWISVGGGVGFLTIYGDGFNLFSRGIVKAGVIAFLPGKGWRAFAVRPELNFIPTGFKAADFGDPRFTYSKTHEWNLSISVGFDLRRAGLFQ